ncbi:MAG: hypothetical protein E7590_00785 [Ruminococcaceae bacterium]|nr:hypothetical protein [Oscillospiraceae bacterium]
MKRFLALLLALCLLIPLAVALPIEVGAATAPILPVTLSLGFPAVKADVGETVDLSFYSITADDGSVLTAADIIWSSAEITVSGGKVTPTEKGVFSLTATANGKAKTVYLLVKDPTDTEYVLFEEDFENTTSFDELLDEGYTVAQRSASAAISVTDGKLVLSGHAHKDCYIRLLLPNWLGDFGDYRIELNAAMTNRIADSHWMAFMYRVQNSNYPYYQNTFRAVTTAGNGTEVAVRNENDAWEVVHTAAYSAAINDGSSTPSYHDFVVEAFGDYVSSVIDGTAVATNVYMPEHDRGRIGLQVRASEMAVESLRVVIPAENSVVDVLDPNSDVINAPSIITAPDNAAALTALATGDTLPAIAILRIDGDLNVTSSAGTAICSLENALTLLHNRVIPAFLVGSSEAADALGAWLADSALTDVFVLANDANLIQRVRNIAPICRGVLDLRQRDLKGIAPATLRAEINGSGSRVVLLPAAYATRDNVAVLHDLLIAVWTEEAADTDTARVGATLSGVNGIVTADPAALAASYTAYFMPTTLTRAPGMIGHRGTPIYGQENTVESAVLAVELGATLVEADFYLTKDNIVVGMHDATIDGTTNGSGKVKDFTYDELCRYAVNDNVNVAVKPIPTLREYCAALKGKDVRLLIEVKDGNTAICQHILSIIDDYGMRDQVNVISFNTAILEKFKELCPELSVGWLGSLSMNYASAESDPEQALTEILSTVQQYNSTYNPNYSSIGPNLIRAANHRGVLILPWTINSRSDFDKLFRYGSHAFTTDYTAWVSDYVKDLRTDKNLYISNTVSGDIPLSLSAIAYNGGISSPARATLAVVEQSGTLSLSYENGVLKTSGTGTATCLLSASFFTHSGSMYSKCTELFTVTVDESYTPPLAAGRWHLGNGAPTVTAEDGALYLDLANGSLYLFDGAWCLQGTLKSEAPTVEIREGYWYIDGSATGVRAEGKDGAAGTVDAALSIGANGNWFIDGTDSGVAATGPKGESGATGIDGKDGENGKDGKDAVADTAALSAATTTATVAVVISTVLLAGNLGLLVWFLVKRRKRVS